MGFGKWLNEKRLAARLTQVQLAERAGISANYVSALEREEPNARDGSPRRPRTDKVKRIAKALNADVNEALAAAGYAGTPAQPKTVGDIIRELQSLGIVDHIEFDQSDPALQDLSPEAYEFVKNSIRVAIEVSLRSQKRE